MPLELKRIWSNEAGLVAGRDEWKWICRKFKLLRKFEGSILRIIFWGIVAGREINSHVDTFLLVAFGFWNHS